MIGIRHPGWRNLLCFIQRGIHQPRAIFALSDWLRGRYSENAEEQIQHLVETLNHDFLGLGDVLLFFARGSDDLRGWDLLQEIWGP